MPSKLTSTEKSIRSPQKTVPLKKRIAPCALSASELGVPSVEVTAQVLA